LYYLISRFKKRYEEERGGGEGREGYEEEEEGYREGGGEGREGYEEEEEGYREGGEEYKEGGYKGGVYK
jgi:hypothetical protein